MGSFDGTCMISGLPIGGGERIKMILIKKSGTNDGAGYLCHPYSAWSPVSPPISGRYDDYGRCEVDDDQRLVLDFALKALNEVHMPVEQGENQYHDIALPDILSEENLSEGLRTGRILLKNSYPPGTTAPMTSVFIREDIWDALLSIEPKRSEWKEPYDFKLLQKAAISYFKPWYGVIEGSQRHRRLTLKFELHGPANFAHKFYGEGFSFVIKQKYLNVMKDNLMDGTWDLQNPVFLQLLKGFTELAWVGDMMYAPMKMWHPVATSGQDHDLESCKAFYEKILEVTAERHREREEDR